MPNDDAAVLPLAFLSSPRLLLHLPSAAPGSAEFGFAGASGSRHPRRHFRLLVGGLKIGKNTKTWVKVFAKIGKRGKIKVFILYFVLSLHLCKGFPTAA
jgi:hypothetical protein